MFFGATAFNMPIGPWAGSSLVVAPGQSAMYTPGLHVHEQSMFIYQLPFLVRLILAVSGQNASPFSPLLFHLSELGPSTPQPMTP